MSVTSFPTSPDYAPTGCPARLELTHAGGATERSNEDVLEFVGHAGEVVDAGRRNNP
jgi:hypothetical protein